MRQFKKWENNLEKDSVKIPEIEKLITKVEYRNQDRFEKTIKTVAYETQQKVSKYYIERKTITPFGIGTSFDDLKMNSVVSTVQRENVWHPYYEVNIEADIDFKDQLQSKIQLNKEANIDGKDVTDLKYQVTVLDQQFQEQNDKIKREIDGLPPKQSFNYKDKIAALRLKEEAEENQQVIDPYTIKVRKVQDDMEEDELEEIMRKFGEVTRVKIPKDEMGRSRGIGFATFRNKEDCTKVADQGQVRYDFYELPVERATMSNKQRDRERERGFGGRGGFGGGDRGDRGERGFGGGDRGDGERRFRGRDGDDRGGRGGFRGRGMGDRDRERGERREPDSGGYLRRNLNR